MSGRFRGPELHRALEILKSCTELGGAPKLTFCQGGPDLLDTSLLVVLFLLVLLSSRLLRRSPGAFQSECVSHPQRTCCV